jgi:hypothetical protein
MQKHYTADRILLVMDFEEIELLDLLENAF